MTTYVLIIWLTSVNTGASYRGSIATAEFHSQSACEQALKRVYSRVRGDIDGVCVQK